MSTREEVSKQLLSAVESDRTDILCAVISALQKSEDESEFLTEILNEPCCEDGTLLHYATKLGKRDIVRALLSAKADPGVHNLQEKTAFDLATSENVKHVFHEELLQATAQSNIGRVCQLLAAGVNVNHCDSEEGRNTPLHWAASYGTREMVQCLCSRGAYVNVLNGVGCTPLHDAVKRKDLQVVKELLSYGADPSIKIKNSGKSAIELAGDNTELVNLLQNPPPQVSTANAAHGLSKLVINTDSGAAGDNLTPNGNVPNMNGTASNGSLPSSPQLRTPTFLKSVPVEDVHHVITEEKLGLLWPQPQSVVQKEGKPFILQDKLYVYVAAGPGNNSRNILKHWRVWRSVFSEAGIELIVDVFTTLSDLSVPHVLCHVNTRLCPGRGLYKLTITKNQIKAICSDKESVCSAIATIYQLLKLYREDDQSSVPILLVDDWPDLYYRGVLLDLSPGRLPVMDSLKHTVDTLSLLKINLIHMFYRFSVAKSQEWQLPYTKSDIMDLEEYCLERGIQLVPVIEVAPPVQYEDIDDLYNVFQDFVSCFPDADFLSLGPRLSSFMLSNEDDVLDVSDAIKLLPVQSNHTLQLCGYPLHDLDSALLQQLPPNIVINEYGIKADHDFKRFCHPLCDQGISFCVCPGTAAWNSIAGCPEAAINNIYHAVKGGVSQGAIGVICCNWSGKGHLTHQPFSWTGYLVAAGLGWNSNCRPDYLFVNVEILLNEHVFQDKPVIGHVIVELGRAETYLLRCARGITGNEANAHSIPDEHGSTLFQFFGSPDSVPLEHLTIETLQRTSKHIKKIQQELEKTEMKCKRSIGNQIVSELQLSCDLMLYALRICRSLMLSGKNPSSLAGFSTINLGIANLAETVKTDLANRLLEILEQYKVVWCEHYLQVTGIQDSLHIFTSLLKHLLPNQETAELLEPQH